MLVNVAYLTGWFLNLLKVAGGLSIACWVYVLLLALVVGLILITLMPYCLGLLLCGFCVDF
jgi:hypothetical protein